MSQTTKKKHVVKELFDCYVLPEGQQRIVKVLCGRGNNLHEVESSDGDRFLVSMPTKFRKNLWIKRGDYLIVDPIEEGDKVKAEISHILYKHSIQFIKEEGKWPAAFDEGNKKEKNRTEKIIPSDSDDDDSDLFVNRNRSYPCPYESEEETSDSGSSEYEDSENDKDKSFDKESSESN